MSITEARSYVEVPAAIPVQGGVLSVANIVQPTGPHDLLGAEYQTDACADANEWVDFCFIDGNIAACDPQAPPAGPRKNFGQPDLVQGSPFAAYGGSECAALGDDGARGRARARLAFTEPRTVDAHVTGLLDATATTLPPASLGEQLALMENIAGWSYGGYATILMSKGMLLKALEAAYVIEAPGGGWITPNGTRVGNVATDPTISTETVYLTGQITLIQGDIQTHIVHEVIRPDGTCDPRRGLAERIWVPLIECLAYKGVVTATSPI